MISNPSILCTFIFFCKDTATTDFYTYCHTLSLHDALPISIGATNNPQFTDETAAMMSFSEAVNVMLLTHEKYNQFTSKKIVDAKSQSEVLQIGRAHV